MSSTGVWKTVLLIFISSVLGFLLGALLTMAMLGIPVSTTHTITGTIVGVGSVRRAATERWGLAGNIVRAWIFILLLFD